MQQPPRKLPRWWKVVDGAAARLKRAGLLSFDLSADPFLKSARVSRGLGGVGEQVAANLRHFLEAFERNGAPTYIGLQALRSTVRRAIRQRVFFEQQFASHPEILETPITGPVFVVGFPRSGTTLLQQLLTLHPGCRWLRRWELDLPFPARQADWGTSADRRRARFDSWLERAAEHPTDLNPMHPDDSPEECWSCLWADFFAHELFVVFGYHGYLRWWRGLPDAARDGAYCLFRKQLQFLIRVEPGCHWVLKSPSHMINIDAILNIFPDARIIQLHRDPRQVVPSFSSLAAYLQYGLTSNWDAETIGQQVLELLGEWAGKNVALRQGLKPDNFYDVQYEHLIKSPLDVVRSIYDRFGMEYPAEMEHRMTTWLARKHGRHRPVHKYKSADFGLEPASIASRFSEYLVRYRVASGAAVESGEVEVR